MKHGKKPKSRKRKIIYAAILTILLLFAIPGLYNGLYIRHYEIDTEKVSAPVRIALITDLHSCKYGDKEEKLISAIEQQQPDIIALCGDFFDDERPDDNSETLLMGIADKYPCFYVTGNHECWSSSEEYAEKMNILNRYGVHILSGNTETIDINGQKINICGVDDPEAVIPGSSTPAADTFEEQLEHLEALPENDNFTILLSHRPERFEDYNSSCFDLVLCGHAHGGQWRIPGILNGLYAPDQGFFPEYAGGKYVRDDMTMIVSRGLARESTRIPRFYNRPELVVIDIL